MQRQNYTKKQEAIKMQDVIKVRESRGDIDVHSEGCTQLFLHEDITYGVARMNPGGEIVPTKRKLLINFVFELLFRATRVVI